MIKKERRSSKERVKPLRRSAVVWSRRALADLEAIGEYIAADNPDRAQSWLTVLIAAADHAAHLPFAGRRTPEFDQNEMREVVRKNYRLVYRVAQGQIEVLSVFEAHRRIAIDLPGTPKRK